MRRVKPVYQGTHLQPIFSFFDKNFAFPPMAFLALYWLLPAIALLASSYSVGTSHALEGFYHLYVEDYVHSLFALNLSLAVFFCYRFVRLLHFRVNDILRNSADNHAQRELVRSFDKSVRLPFSWPVALLSLLVAIFCFFTLLEKIQGEGYEYWWGNHIHGFAGYAYSIVMSIFVFFAVQYIAALSSITFFFKNFASSEMRLRPLHPDGASGLGLFASMMMSIWAQTILLSVALLIVIRTRYLDLADTYFVWVLGGALVLVFPFAALLPLFQTVRSASKLKKNLIRRLIIEKFSSNTPCSRASLGEVEGFLSLQKELNQISVFPIVSVRFLAIAGFNLLQAYLAVATLAADVW